MGGRPQCGIQPCLGFYCHNRRALLARIEKVPGRGVCGARGVWWAVLLLSVCFHPGVGFLCTPLNFSPIPPSTEDKLDSALQPPHFNGVASFYTVAVSSSVGFGLRCSICVFTVIGRKARVEVKVVWWE